MAKENDTNNGIVYCCPRCLCRSIQFVKKTLRYWCRKCGNEWGYNDFLKVEEESK